ncbi:MAG: hypothetical protein ACYSUX_18325, partial [Planctomycetota bacterium]
KDAIRLQCLKCLSWQQKEVAICSDEDCFLWPYRLRHRISGSAENRDFVEQGSKKSEGRPHITAKRKTG